MTLRNWVAGLLIAGSSIVALAPVASAHDTSGDIFYTTYDAMFTGGDDRVFHRTYSYDTGLGTIVYGPQIAISSESKGLLGSDGLVFDPTDAGYLLVGGQDTGNFYRVKISDGSVTPSGDTGEPIFHLTIGDGPTVIGTGIPNSTVVEMPLPFAAPTLYDVVDGAGDPSDVTGIAFDPLNGLVYYTSSGPSGIGSFGTIALTGPTELTTTELLSDVPAAHGISFDPFTGDIILFGDGDISQFHPVGAGGSIISTLSPGADNDLDQGTVDGHGHLFVASNGKAMVFADYASTGLVGSASFVDVNLDDFPEHLDDVAPLSGQGSQQPVPEPASMLLFGLGGLGAVGTSLRRRKLA